MNPKLFFIRQQEGGVESHRWLFLTENGNFTYSEFYPNLAVMMTNCIDTLQRTLLTDDIIFEYMRPGIIQMLQKVAASRYHNTVNYFDECFNENHEPGCTCEGLRDLEEVNRMGVVGPL